jgi:cytochrome c551
MIRILSCFSLGLWLTFFGTCSSKKEASPHDFQTRIKHQQYVAKGKVLYVQLCANCHQIDGTGLGKLYPPLLNSDYMKNDVDRTIRIIKNGMKGEIVVNDVVYNQEMPHNPKLTNLEIAELTAYIFKKFADSVVLVSTEEVEALLR